MRRQGTTRALLIAAAPLVAFALVVSIAFSVLHGARVVLPNLDLSVPHDFDPRYAKRRAKLIDRPPYMLLFTGDSRVNNGIDPSFIDAVDSFTMGTGGQTIPLTEAIVLDTLVEIDRRPRYLVIGVTPDYLVADAIVNDPRTAQLLDRYERARAWQRNASFLDHFVARHLPAFFYRENMLRDTARMLLLFAGGPRPPSTIFEIELLHPVSWRQYFDFFVEPQSDLGWELQSLSGFVEGSYPFREPRELLRAPYRADDAALGELVEALRDAGIEPLFLIMPFHDSFYAVHGEAVREEMRRAVYAVAGSRGVDVIEVPFDTADASLYVDGHHLSRRGAEAFSRALNRPLAALGLRRVSP